jgi:energy-coupling factor transporter ATP-binding protein EcfA2
MEKTNFDTQVYSVDDLDIKQGSFNLICSKRASGKSILIRHLVKHLLDIYDYQIICLFSETAELNEDYNFIDKSYIFKTSQIEIKIKKILDIQSKNIKKGKKINILIILDDVQVHSRSKELINLSTLGRHYYITVLFSTQYCKSLCSSSIRNNLDGIFFSDLGETALRAIYDSLHVNMNFKLFNEYINENNTNYQFIYYNGREPDKKKRLNIVKAKIFENLKLIK